ncbi:MAG: preprotein translocase subunit SecE [Gemmatimonadota bacterium]
MLEFLKKTQKFTEDVQVEMRRVTWPDREQLRNATIVILVFVLIMAAVIGLMDTVFAGFVRLVIRTFGG